jgi:D-glycero-beta-D-manno-heptose 1-phosphate adenylyltransferase
MSFHSRLEDKIAGRQTAAEQCRKLHESGKKIVFTNGVFDILHPGHVDYLCRARDLGDVLVLGLNTDTSVKQLEKAPDRPLNDQWARARVLAALECVDFIVMFEEQTPYELIRELQPDVLVKGDDYTIEQIAGHDVVLGRGGKVITVPLVKGYSTTGLIKKITGKS